MPPTSPSAVPPLLTVEQVAELPADVVLVEVDEDMSTYVLGHVPGARGVDWLDDLQHPQHRGFLEPEALAALMDRLGVENGTHVVLLGDADNRFAALAYWYLAYYGHERLSLVDGGRAAWLAAGLPLTDEEPPPVQAGTRYVVGAPRLSLRATRDHVLSEFVGSPPGRQLVDCRTAAEHSGQLTGIQDLPLDRDRVTGHIPGSVNLPSSDLLDGTGRFKGLAELGELFAAAGAHPDVEVVLYCRIADRSALMWFALHELLGHPRVRHYDGGWAEYSALVDVPVVAAQD